MSSNRKSAFLVIAFAILLFVSCGLLTRVNAQTGKAPLTHETMWLMKRVGAPVPSPDGKWVVFSLVEPAYDDKDQVSDLSNLILIPITPFFPSCKNLSINILRAIQLSVTLFASN